MSEKNLFELASRENYRFASSRGELAVEQLWVIPLEGGNSLDNIAVALHDEIQKSPTTSFTSKVSKGDKHLQNKFDLVKYIIDVRISERDARLLKAEKDGQRRILREAIAQKKSEELLSGSAEDLEKRLADLDD